MRVQWLEKCMNKWRTDERRSKKESFAVARENEKVQDMMATEGSYSILTSNGNVTKDATKVSLIVHIVMRTRGNNYGTSALMFSAGKQEEKTGGIREKELHGVLHVLRTDG